MNKIFKGILALSLVFMFTACEIRKNGEVIYSDEKEKVELNYKKEEVDGKMVYDIENNKYVETEKRTNLVKIEMTSGGIIIAELYKEYAPITVENFQDLVESKYYDGIIFHRVIKDFMIQGGDPTGTGTGGSSKTIKGEFKANGVNNTLSHTRGVLSMARKGSNPETEYTMNSGSSQFFIVHNDSTFLDGNYAAFGKVIAGMDMVDAIANVQTDSYDKPLKDQKMLSVRFVEKIGE